jgi:hypothetical protein
MPFAEMFVSWILEFWDLSEDIPWLFVPGSQGRYDWCFTQTFKRRKDFTAILEPETVLGAEEAGATKRPAPSITSPPTEVKRKKKNMSVRPDYACVDLHVCASRLFSHGRVQRLMIYSIEL